jgi:hypothetical protein
MASTPTTPPARHVPFKKGGWGAAILTTAAAVGAFLTAFYIHTQTYRHPRDVQMRQRGSAPAHGAAEGSHGAPGAGASHGAAPAAEGGHAAPAGAPKSGGH